MHFDRTVAVVVAAPLMKAPARGPLVGVQDRFDLGDRLLKQVIQLEKHRAVAALQLAPELQHHLARPVVAFDESFAAIVRRIPSERAGDIGAGWTVVVLY